MTLRPIRIGIVGLGRMGRRHAENLANRVPGAELVAACSRATDETAWARDVLGVAAGYAEYEELLRHPGLDAVFLATPTVLHADQIVSALEAGKHVFCEKPLALELADCLRAEEAAARYPDKIVMIGFVRRFDPSYRDAHAQIEAGVIGRPFLVRSQTGDKLDPSGFFVRYAGTSGGIFLDVSIHDIDLARWLLGNPGRCASSPPARWPCTRISNPSATSTTAWPWWSSRMAGSPVSMRRGPWRMATIRTPRSSALRAS